MADGRLDGRALDAIAYLVMAAMALFCVAPIVVLLVVSVLPADALLSGWPGLAGLRPTLANYAEMMQHTDLPRLMANSLAVMLVAVTLCLAAGVPAAYAFARLRFGGRRGALAVQLVLSMVPTMLMLVPLMVLTRVVGLVDSRAGLSLVHAGLLLPLAAVLMIGALEAVPREVEEAARLDGCSRLAAMRLVVLPLARDGIGAAAVIVALSSWNEFLFALVLTSGSGARTWPVGLRMLVGEFQLPWGLLAAGGVIVMLPVLAMFALIERAVLPPRRR